MIICQQLFYQAGIYACMCDISFPVWSWRCVRLALLLIGHSFLYHFSIANLLGLIIRLLLLLLLYYYYHYYCFWQRNFNGTVKEVVKEKFQPLPCKIVTQSTESLEIPSLLWFPQKKKLVYNNT